MARVLLLAFVGALLLGGGAARADTPELPEPTEEVHQESAPRYLLESISIEGNTRTRSGVVRAHIPLKRGDVIDPESGDLDTIEWGLLGTGWFDGVQLSLRRGSSRGWVVLVVEVRERNTMVIRDLVFGISEGVNGSRDPNADIVPYVGFSIAETNLIGTGITLSLAGLMSQTQQGFELGYVHQHLRSSPYAFRSAIFTNNAREFYGNDPIISQSCPDDVPDCIEEVEAKNAVAFYRRGGLRLGFARDAGSNTHFSLDWQGEAVRVLSRPEAASTLRGTELRPIDFAIEDGRSFVSLLRVGVLYDRRDDPALTSQGLFLKLEADLATRLIGSTYDFVRFEGLVRYWQELRPRHALRYGAYAGVIFGQAPFFYKFHVSDLSDLLPSRVLDMQIDRRPANDIFGTTIRFMLAEEIAVRVDLQYDYTAYRSLRRPALRGLNIFANVGLFMLADPLDFRIAVPGYEGFNRIPIDMTFDVGLRVETTIGVFQFGFSNLLGFIKL